jgi:N-acylneuraminate cytidylyltransferase
MIAGKTVLAVIPARGGSKGVPRKNIRVVAGKPLIAWTIEEARRSSHIDRLIVSTDDSEIAAVAQQWRCEVPFMRPPELARDETPGIAPVIHAMEALPERYDLVVLLQPTSPLRSGADIDGCIATLVARQAKACVSVAEPGQSPYWMYKLDDKDRLQPLLEGAFNRRQDLPKVYSLNGAVYVAEAEWLLQSNSFVGPGTIGYIMPIGRSLDIDTETDLAYFALRKSEATT